MNKLNILFTIIKTEWLTPRPFHLLYVFLPLFLIITSISSAQEIYLNNNRQFIFQLPEDSLLIWNETIIPGTIRWELNGDSVGVIYEFKNNSIKPDWEKTGIQADSVTVRFEVLPYPFHQPVSLWDSSQIRIVEGDIFYNPATPKPRTELIESSGLEYDGALTRGFSLGNNQSLVFDSELNLQLGGNIGDGYEIKAAITDNNLPIQPDGTTRQIQEFDKVFLEIKKDQHSILAGDFDAINPQGYFMRYNRKLKGAQYSYSGLPSYQPWQVRGSAGVSRGKFTRQIITPTEGNQGPYPLRGENGELFIVILAGSEKIFIDGQLLIRGEDADYIMDYNQGEITFTRNILINSRHRITVEFEYAQFNFQKSHNAFEARYRKERITSYVNFFQENDSKSVTGDLQLTAEDLAVLNMAGDATEEFYKTGVREAPEGFNTNSILYARTDTTIEGNLYDDILMWSTDPQEAILVVSFSEVGAGNGDYIISQNPSPNGRVYEWISPDPVTGLRRGNFAPIIPLLAPQQKQMLTAGGELRVGKRGQLSGEVGISRHDLNRFSSMDDNDNTGAALKFNFSTPLQIGAKWILTPFGGYEGNGNNFRTLDPYRNPEFARDWNLTGIQMLTSEQLPTVGLRLGRSQKIFSQYKYEGLFRSNLYNGNRHTAQLLYDTLGWKVDAIMGLLEAKSLLYNTRFLRPAINLERVVIKKGNWRLGWSYFEDRNETRDKISDTLSPVSFIQDKMSFYIKNDPEANTYLYGGYSKETPKIPKGNQFEILEKAAEWNVGGHFHQWKDFKLGYTIKQRDVESFNPQNPERSSNLLGRLDVKADLIKKAFKWAAGYEIGNGQEPKVEYKYVKVQKGEGIYTWVDDGDGVEELNEFEQAPFADQGEYIRLSVFNNDFVRTRALNLQQTINVDLKNLVTKGLLPKIAALSTYQLSRKIREDMDSPFWNPFYRQYADTSVLANSSTWRNILYWNRSSPRYDIQLGYVKQDNQVLQTSGFEIRGSDDLTFRSRISLQKKMDMVLNLRNGIKENRSQNFSTRNYKISQLEAGPELNVILKDKLRFTGTYQYLSQENLDGNEDFSSNKLSLEGVWRKTNTTDFRVQVSLVQVEYVSAGNLNVDFVMLQGLQNGTNILWSAQFNTRLNKTLILTLQYNGRQTGEEKTIHTGTAQVRASF